MCCSGDEQSARAFLCDITTGESTDCTVPASSLANERSPPACEQYLTWDSDSDRENSFRSPGAPPQIKRRPMQTHYAFNRGESSSHPDSALSAAVIAKINKLSEKMDSAVDLFARQVTALEMRLRTAMQTELRELENRLGTALGATTSQPPQRCGTVFPLDSIDLLRQFERDMKTDATKEGALVR